jgi:hypothetical protein
MGIRLWVGWLRNRKLIPGRGKSFFSSSFSRRSRGSSVGIVTACWLDDREFGVLVPVRVGFFSSVRHLFPCGGGVEHLQRSPASRRRRRKGKSRIWDSKIWSRVPQDSDPRMTELARISSNCKRKTRPLVRDSAPHQETRKCRTLIKFWSYAPDGCFIRRQTGRLTVGRNIRLVDVFLHREKVRKETQIQTKRQSDKVTKWKVTQKDRLSRKSEVIPDWEDKSLVYVL